MADRLLELDARRRATMTRIGRPEHRRYIVTEEPDGTLILTPAVVISESEARWLASPARARIESDPRPPVKRRRRG